MSSVPPLDKLSSVSNLHWQYVKFLTAYWCTHVKCPIGCGFYWCQSVRYVELNSSQMPGDCWGERWLCLELTDTFAILKRKSCAGRVLITAGRFDRAGIDQRETWQGLPSSIWDLQVGEWRWDQSQLETQIYNKNTIMPDVSIIQESCLVTSTQCQGTRRIWGFMLHIIPSGLFSQSWTKPRCKMCA